MNIFSQSMNRIKGAAGYAVMHAMSAVSLAIFAIGAVCAGGILYFFALTAPLPSSGNEIVVRSTISVSKSVVANVAKYVSAKKQSAVAVPNINGAVFYVPPATP